MGANNNRIQPKIARIRRNWPEVDQATLASDFGVTAAGASRFLDILDKASSSLQYREVVAGATDAKNARSPDLSTPFKPKDVQMVINSKSSTTRADRSNVSCPDLCSFLIPHSCADMPRYPDLERTGQTSEEPVRTSRGSTQDLPNNMSDSSEAHERSPPAEPIDPSASRSILMLCTLPNIDSCLINLQTPLEDLASPRAV